MSEDQGFLGRWSRLKRAARRPAEQRSPDDPQPENAAPAPVAEAEPPFDPASLPPIEELSADSDYTPFLARAVPAELRRLALRRAWASDPAIAGFRGFADYDWDCNAPGFGSLLPIDDVARLCRTVFDGGEPKVPQPAPESPEAGAPEPERPPAPAEIPPAAGLTPELPPEPAPQPVAKVAVAAPRRRHGGALPV